MHKNVKEVQYFFYSQAFADGFRASFAILLPALIGSLLGHFETGLTIALGAMCVSLTDAPGPFLHKRNGMLFCAGFAFIIAILTAFARMNPYTMGAEVAFVTFFFSMFVVYGTRATGVGNAAILVMILNMDRPVNPGDVLPHAGFLLLGGLFYLSFSLLLYKIQPYRHAQRALGDCIREIATYLSIRADFYNVKTDL
ncbi:MAG TPA: FUSC family membrane protein, partial [Flavisolibacter sp.]